MTVLFTRWLAVALVAIGFGVAGLHRSVCIADERAAAAPAAPGLGPAAPAPELPIGAEADQRAVPASPWLTY
jgi:hypothetical protein